MGKILEYLKRDWVKTFCRHYFSEDDLERIRNQLYDSASYGDTTFSAYTGKARCYGWYHCLKCSDPNMALWFEKEISYGAKDGALQKAIKQFIELHKAKSKERLSA